MDQKTNKAQENNLEIGFRGLQVAKIKFLLQRPKKNNYLGKSYQEENNYFENYYSPNSKSEL